MPPRRESPTEGSQVFLQGVAPFALPSSDRPGKTTSDQQAIQTSNRFSTLVEQEEGGAAETVAEENKREKPLVGFRQSKDLCAVQENKNQNRMEGQEGNLIKSNCSGTSEEEEPMIQHVAINRRAAAYSEEEMQFFREAITQGRTSQTHFADPGASFCYRCPICTRMVNWEHLPQSARMHFSMMHRAPITYHVTINN